MGDLESLITTRKAVFRISTGEISISATLIGDNEFSKMMAAKNTAAKEVLPNANYRIVTKMYENNPRCEFCVKT